LFKPATRLQAGSTWSAIILRVAQPRHKCLSQPSFYTSRCIRARRLHQSLAHSQRHLRIVGYTCRFTFGLQRPIRWKASADPIYTEKFDRRAERITEGKTEEAARSSAQ
jgi:hypothetical protein